MSIHFGLFVMIVLVVVTIINGSSIFGTLTEQECKTYFASDDINLQLQAIFNCPKKWRPKTRRVESYIAKRSTIDKKYTKQRFG